MNRKNSESEGLDPGTRRLFSYLDGELDPSDRAAFETEVASDPSLEAELRSCRAIFRALDAIEPLAPSADFGASVLISVRTRWTLGQRFRSWLAGGSDVATPSVFDAMLDGRLPAKQAEVLEALAARDSEVAGVLAGWRRLHRELGRLPELAPAAGFADRVMARVPLSAVERSPGRLATLLGGLWPAGRKRLAAVSGIAVGPTAVVAGIAYMLFTNNPLVTASNLGGFLWNKVSDSVAVASQGIMDSATNMLAAMGAGGVPWTFSLPIVLISASLFAGLTLASVWILYRNVPNTSGLEPRHAST